MRIRNIWTIRNEYKDKVHWGVWTTTDTVYLSSDHDGTLGHNEEVAIEVGEGVDAVKLGFAKGTFVPLARSWVAEPTRVATNQSAVLQADKSIVSRGEVYPDPRMKPDANVFDSINVNNIARTVVKFGLGKVPSVGPALSGIVGFVWPKDKPKPEDLIRESEERMKKWVRGRIQDYDRATLASSLAGVRANLQEYLDAVSRDKRKRSLDEVVTTCNNAQPHFLKSDYTPGTIAILVDVATIHISALRERVVKAQELYVGDELKDVPGYQKRLTEAIKQYRDFVVNVAFPAELKWRSSPEVLEVHNGELDVLSRGGALVRDWSTREVHAWDQNGMDNRARFDYRPLFNLHKAKVANSYEVELRRNAVDAAELWPLLDPTQATLRPIPLDRVVWVGPLEGLSRKGANEHDYKSGDAIDSGVGEIEEIIVRSADRVDAIQVKRKNGTGPMVGNPNGGEPRTVRVPAGAHIRQVDTWWDHDLFAIQFYFSNGESAGPIGNRGGRRDLYFQGSTYPDHRLSALKVNPGLTELHCGWSPAPNYYDA